MTTHAIGGRLPRRARRTPAAASSADACSGELGAAHRQRESSGPHPRPSKPVDEVLHRDLATALGRPAFDDAFAEGRTLTPADALRRALPEPDA
ncbi:hypothetical protein AB0J72_21630 [Dactylosporangium sp. NPDC049742]|uniref:hypothetical protein n=1 Tax=Dactylosporangium sp. NPDC049742 TaxID=3154737 RepID=UPI003447CC6E